MEESNKSYHDFNSCEVNYKGDEYEDGIMQKDYNEYDESHTSNNSVIKPDSITQYSFSRG